MGSSDQTTNDESTGADDGTTASLKWQHSSCEHSSPADLFSCASSRFERRWPKNHLPCLHALLRCGSDSSVGTERAARRGDYCGRCPSNDRPTTTSSSPPQRSNRIEEKIFVSSFPISLTRFTSANKETFNDGGESGAEVAAASILDFDKGGRRLEYQMSGGCQKRM